MTQPIFLHPYIKGHEGKMFYSSEFGDVKYLFSAKLGVNHSFFTANFVANEQKVMIDSISVNNAGIGNIYPSREFFAKYPFDPISAWDEWRLANLPKTWETLVKVGHACPRIADTSYPSSTKEEKSAVALLKILQIIDKFFGGVPSLEEWDDNCCELDIDCASGNYIGWEDELSDRRSPIAFRSADYADEFLSHEPNVKLIRDFFMLSKD